MNTSEEVTRGRIAQWVETQFIEPIEDFDNPSQEWRRLFSELFGTFFLVLVAAGGGMMGQAFPNTDQVAAEPAPAPPKATSTPKSPTPGTPDR